MKPSTSSQQSFIRRLFEQAVRGGWLSQYDTLTDIEITDLDILQAGNLISDLKKRKPFDVRHYGKPGAYRVVRRVALRYAATAIPGGIARGMSPSDFDQDELKAGIKVEQEHLIGGGYSKAEARAKAQDIAMDHLAEIPDYYTRLKKMESDVNRTAGRVLDFGRRSVRPKHSIKINGNTYALSDYAGAALSIPDDEGEGDSEGARLIRGPAHGQPYRYLWVYDSDRGDLGMFRVTDGSEKVWGKADRMVREIMLLDRKGELNRVSNAEARSITRAMRKKEDDAVRDLRSWAKELETDYQQFVNQVAADVFESEIVPEIEGRMADLRSGVVPFGFQVNENLIQHGKDMASQMQGHVLNQVLEKFTTAMIDDEVRRRGRDPESEDIQASYWALGDIREEAWDRFGG
jgi:hypothetical protein